MRLNLEKNKKSKKWDRSLRTSKKAQGIKTPKLAVKISERYIQPKKIKKRKTRGLGLQILSVLTWVKVSKKSSTGVKHETYMPVKKQIAKKYV